MPTSPPDHIRPVRHRRRLIGRTSLLRQQEMLVAIVALAAVGAGTTAANTVAAPVPAAMAQTAAVIADQSARDADLSARDADRAGPDGDLSGRDADLATLERAGDRTDRSRRPGTVGLASPLDSPASAPDKAQPARERSAATGQRADPGRAGEPEPEPAARKAPPPAWVHPMPDAATTSCFGHRWGVLHGGVDLASPPGTPIRAVGAGTVIHAGWVFPGYGISVMIDHGGGYYTHYAHASQAKVSVGDKVKPGDTVALEGSTGDSSGPHLHFEVHKDGLWNQVEPTRWLDNRDVHVGGC